MTIGDIFLSHIVGNLPNWQTYRAGAMALLLWLRKHIYAWRTGSQGAFAGALGGEAGGGDSALRSLTRYCGSVVLVVRFRALRPG